jgi:hypothetical protein
MKIFEKHNKQKYENFAAITNTGQQTICEWGTATKFALNMRLSSVIDIPSSALEA